MAEKYKKPCLDSSVFIGGIDGEICKGIKRGVVFRYIWERARAGDYKIYISTVALAEVYKQKRKVTSKGETLDEFLELVNESFVMPIEVDRDCGVRAHEFCRQYSPQGLFPNDAIHLACALRANCDVLLAWDTPLNTISHSNIRIEEPRIIGGDLFAPTEFATPDEISAYAARLVGEKAIRDAAERTRYTEATHQSYDAIADRVVGLHLSGALPSPFSSKHIRECLNGCLGEAQANSILPDYCPDGAQTRRGRKPRFERISKGNYIVAKSYSLETKQ